MVSVERVLVHMQRRCGVCGEAQVTGGGENVVTLAQIFDDGSYLRCYDCSTPLKPLGVKIDDRSKG